MLIKRLIDIVTSVTLIIILSPLLIVITVVLFLDNKGAVFFKQKRPGLNGRLFTLFKFKTMRDQAVNSRLLSDGQRVTLIGKFLRYTSLDELPQLFNVIKGDMSLIGPRPLLEEYIPLYNNFQQRRHEVKPGITGWAQVNGRNLISWNEKFCFDVYYVDNINLMLDCRILLLTLIKVVRREGIQGNMAGAVEKFKGN